MSRARLSLCSFLYLISSILSSNASVTDKYWVGPDNGLWSDPNNWTLTMNGPGAAGVPSGGYTIIGDRAQAFESSSRNFIFDGDYSASGAGFGVLNLSASSGATLNFIESSGTLTCAVESIGPNVIYQHSGGANQMNTGLAIAGTYLVSGNAQVRIGGPSDITISGSLQQSGGSINCNNGIILNGGSYTLSAGHVGSDYTEIDAGTCRLAAGSLSTSFLINHDALILSPGVSTTLDTYFQSSLGKLEMELDGGTAGQYAHLSPFISASLNGLLTINLANNFSPELGDSFLLIDSPSLTGTFSSYNLPALSNGLEWQPTYTPTTFSLSVVVPEPSAILLLPFLLILLRTQRQKYRTKFQDLS